MLELIMDLWGYSKKHKKFWKNPLVLCMMLVGVLVIFGEGSATSPFIYTLI